MGGEKYIKTQNFSNAPNNVPFISNRRRLNPGIGPQNLYLGRLFFGEAFYECLCKIFCLLWCCFYKFLFLLFVLHLCLEVDRIISNQNEALWLKYLPFVLLRFLTYSGNFLERRPCLIVIFGLSLQFLTWVLIRSLESLNSKTILLAHQGDDGCLGPQAKWQAGELRGC